MVSPLAVTIAQKQQQLAVISRCNCPCPCAMPLQLSLPLPQPLPPCQLSLPLSLPLPLSLVPAGKTQGSLVMKQGRPSGRKCPTDTSQLEDSILACFR